MKGGFSQSFSPIQTRRSRNLKEKVINNPRGTKSIGEGLRDLRDQKALDHAKNDFVFIKH